VKLVFEKQTVEAAKQKGIGLAAPGRDLLINILKGTKSFSAGLPTDADAGEGARNHTRITHTQAGYLTVMVSTCAPATT
jgi:hypothetical protein